MNASPPPSQLRSRLILLLIVAAFFSSFGIAAFLRFTGWTPDAGRNVGELLAPPRALSGLSLQRADGSAFAWKPDTNTWRILVVPAPGCTVACSKLADALHRVWLLQGRKADRLEVLWFGPLPAEGRVFRNLIQMQPDPALAAALPEPSRADALPVYVADPEGYLVLHYRAGFDPAGLKKDLGKVLK